MLRWAVRARLPTNKIDALSGADPTLAAAEAAAKALPRHAFPPPSRRRIGPPLTVLAI
jgi:hypothetical protein